MARGARAYRSRRDSAAPVLFVGSPGRIRPRETRRGRGLEAVGVAQEVGVAIFCMKCGLSGRGLVVSGRGLFSARRFKVAPKRRQVPLLSVN